MSKVTIYTCVTGGYDNLPQPEVLHPDFEFVSFVKKGTKKSDSDGAWQVRELDFDDPSNVVVSRYPKLNPHKVLPDVEYGLWMDANVSVIGSGFYDTVLSKVEEGVLYAGIRHPLRDDLGEEALRCLATDKETFRGALKVWKHLRSEGYIRHSGMLENNIILRKHSDPTVMAVDEMWWDAFMKVSHRDQLSLMLCMQKAGLEPSLLLPEGMDSRTCPDLRYSAHVGIASSRGNCYIARKVRDARREIEKHLFRTIIG